MNNGQEISEPSVSVVMPAYNAARYIAGAIRSVIDQTFSNWELIIVDDGSQDETAAIIKPFLDDARISYIHKENGGAATARNVGIKVSHGNLIAFLDADDLWVPEKLARQLDCFEKYPEIGICGTGMMLIDSNGKITSQGTVPAFHGNPFPKILEYSLANMSTAMIRREVFEKAGLFDETLGTAPEDYEFWLRAGKHALFHVTAEPLACYRQGHGSCSDRYAEKRRELAMNVIIPRFLKEQDGRKYVKWHHLRRMRASCYKYRGDAETNRRNKVYWYLRSLLTWPFYGEAWSTVPWMIFPHSWIRQIKRFLKRNNTTQQEKPQ